MNTTTLHNRVMRTIAAHRADAPVLVYEGRSYNGAELCTAVNAVRDGLLPHVLGRLRPTVALCMQPSDHLVIAMLAIMAAGAAYVPILPSVPHARATRILRDSEACAVVTDDAVDRDALREAMVPVLRFSALRSARKSVLGYTDNSDGTTLACILYTSGSTGVPKGVLISHAAALHFVTTAWDSFGPRGPVGCMKTVVSFVDHIAEVYTPLANNGLLVVMPSAASHDLAIFFDRMSQHSVTCLVVVPSFLRALLSYLKAFPLIPSTLRVQHVDTSGESLPADLGVDFFTQFPHATLANAYGATETVCDCHAIVFRDSGHVTGTVRHGGRTTMGTPVAGYTPYIVNDELCVSGPIANGYVDPLMTAERFLQNPFDPEGAVVYRLGDIVVKDDDGLFYCMGRADTQIKIRGQRVDLAEIRAAVLAVPGVTTAVMAVADAGTMSQQVLTFVVGSATVAEVDASLRAVLPSYMVPITTVVVTIPLLENGKMDTVSLVAVWRAERKSRPILMRPSNPREEAIAACAASVMGVDPSEVDIGMSFFEQGGTSISVVRLLELLRARDGNDFASLTLSDVLHATTLAAVGVEKTTSTDTAAAIDTMYRIVLLRDYPKQQEALEHLIRHFPPQDPMLAIMGFSELDFSKLLLQVFPVYAASATSLVAENAATGAIAGVLLAAVLADEIEPTGPFLASVLRLFHLMESSEGSTRDRLVALHGASRVVHGFVLETDSRLPHHASLSLATALERRLLVAAKDAGAGAVFSVNTHPVTIAIAKSLEYSDEVVTVVADVCDPATGAPMFPNASKDIFIATSAFTF